MRYILVDLIEGSETGDNHVQAFDSLAEVEATVRERAETYEAGWPFDNWAANLQLYSIAEELTIDIRSIVTVKFESATPPPSEPSNVVPLRTFGDILQEAIQPLDISDMSRWHGRTR